MKKSAKTGRAIRPPRSPVLAIRVPAPVYGELKKAAKTVGMTLSDYVAQLIANGKEWQAAFGDARKLMQWANAESQRIVDAALKTELRRRNWKPDETGCWRPPEVHRLPPNGFIDPAKLTPPALEAEPASAALDPRITTEIKRAVQAAFNERRKAS
jgi:molybdopterin converting factor small subunit